MNQKKTMNLWQMLVLVILSAGMLVTMFLPAYSITGKSYVRMYNKLMSSEIMDLAEQLGGIDEDAIEKQADKEIEAMEEDFGGDLSNISPFRIMTRSAASFFGVDNEDESSDGVSGIMKAYTMQRVLFWIVYIMAIIVMLILILSFSLKWSKYISLIISIVYGLFGTVIFGIFQFHGPKVIAKHAGTGSFGGLGSMGLGSMDSMMAKAIACFWGFAFLTAFFICIFLVIMGAVSLFVGNAQQKSNPEPWSDPIPDPNPIPWPEPTPILQPEPTPVPRPVPRPEPTPVPQPVPQPQQPPMGQVKCTKGVALGQGFSLPEDRKVVVGKNNQSANMVLPHPNVSKVHCSIRYKAATNSYIVKDHSLNGTFVNGTRLQKDVAMEFPAGTVLQLADGSNEITLG